MSNTSMLDIIQRMLVPPDDSTSLICDTSHNWVNFSIGIFICLGMFVSYLPQHHKIISTGTSEGFSPLFLLLGSLGAWSNVVNIVILQWDVMRCCSVVSFGTCIEHILGVIQILVQWVMFILVFILFMIYFPANKKYLLRVSSSPGDDVAQHEQTATTTHGQRREAQESDSDSDDDLVESDAAAQTPLLSDGHQYDKSMLSSEWRTSLIVAVCIAVHFAITLITSVLLIWLNGAADKETRQWAGVMGVFSMCMAMIQYLPQIWKTWRAKTVGALSITMMLMQTPGGFLFAYSLAGREGTNWTTWITYLTSACLQGVLLIMCIIWNAREKRLKRSLDEQEDDEIVDPLNAPEDEFGGASRALPIGDADDDRIAFGQQSDEDSLMAVSLTP